MTFYFMSTSAAKKFQIQSQIFDAVYQIDVELN